MPDLRATLAAGGPAIGLWGSIPSSLTAEAAAQAGADYVVVDQQHGAVAASLMTAMLQAIGGARVPALVRVAQNDPWTIGNVLDLGAAGVIVPMVEDGEQAARAVAACRYAPDGIRSFGALRGGGEAPLCLVMIETRAGLERAEEIAATPGLDGVYVACRAAGVAAGVHCLAAEDVPEQAARFAIVTAGGDMLYLREALARALAVARGG